MIKYIMTSFLFLSSTAICLAGGEGGGATSFEDNNNVPPHATAAPRTVPGETPETVVPAPTPAMVPVNLHLILKLRAARDSEIQRHAALQQQKEVLENMADEASASVEDPEQRLAVAEREAEAASAASQAEFYQALVIADGTAPPPAEAPDITPEEGETPEGLTAEVDALRETCARLTEEVQRLRKSTPVMARLEKNVVNEGTKAVEAVTSTTAKALGSTAKAVDQTGKEVARAAEKTNETFSKAGKKLKKFGKKKKKK